MVARWILHLTSFHVHRLDLSQVELCRCHFFEPIATELVQAWTSRHVELVAPEKLTIPIQCTLLYFSNLSLNLYLCQNNCLPYPTSHIGEMCCWSHSQFQRMVENNKASFRDKFLGLPLRRQSVDVGIGIHSRCCQPELLALNSTIRGFLSKTYMSQCETCFKSMQRS